VREIFPNLGPHKKNWRRSISSWSAIRKTSRAYQCLTSGAGIQKPNVPRRYGKRRAQGKVGRVGGTFLPTFDFTTKGEEMRRMIVLKLPSSPYVGPEGIVGKKLQPAPDSLIGARNGF